MGKDDLENPNPKLTFKDSQATCKNFPSKASLQKFPSKADLSTFQSKDDLEKSQAKPTFSWPGGVSADRPVLQPPGVPVDELLNHFTHHIPVITLRVATCAKHLY